MSQQPETYILLFEKLLKELKDAGFVIGVDTHVHLHELMNTWEPSDDHEKDLNRLKVKLSSLIAHSPEEQQKFYSRFTNFQKEFLYEPTATLEEEEKKQDPLPQKVWLFWLIFTGLLLLLASIWSFIQVRKGISDPHLYVVQEDYSQTVRLYDSSEVFSLPYLFEDSVVERFWKIGDSVISTTSPTIRYNFQEEGNQDIRLVTKGLSGFMDSVEAIFPVKSPVKHYLKWEAQEGNRQKFSFQYDAGTYEGGDASHFREEIYVVITDARDNLEFRDWQDTFNSNHTISYKVSLHFGDGDSIFFSTRDSLSSRRIEHLYQKAGQYEVQAIIEQEITTKETDSLTKVNTAIRSIQVVIDEPKPDLVPVPTIDFKEEDISDLVKEQERTYYLEWIGVGIFLWYLLLEGYFFRRRRYTIDANANLKPPVWQPLLLDRPLINLFRTPTFEKWALDLRQQLQTEQDELDLPLSLQQTLEKGGFPALHFKKGRQTAQYLFIIEQKNYQDQQAMYFQEMVAELEGRDISAEIWFLDPAKPSRLYRDPLKPGISRTPDALNRTYGNYRLIMIGEGEFWEEYPQLFSRFKGWREAAWLSSRPVSDWDTRESFIQQYFTLLPAQTHCLQDLVLLWSSQKEAYPISKWRLISRSEERPDLERMTDKAELKAFLGEKAWNCLCACSIYPEIYWELTLGFSKICGLYKEDRAELFQEDAFLRLVSLEWFRKGKIPEKWKTEFYKEIPADLHKEVYQHLVDVLKQPHNLPDKGTVARQRSMSLLAMYEYQVAEDKREALQELSEFIQGLPINRVKDVVSIRTLKEINKSAYTIPLPESFFHRGIRLFGWRDWVIAGRALVIGVFLFLLGWALRSWVFPPPEPYEPPFTEEELRLETDEAKARWETYQGYYKSILLDSLTENDLKEVEGHFHAALGYQEDYVTAKYNLEVVDFLRLRIFYLNRGEVDIIEDSLMKSFVEFQPARCDSLAEEIEYLIGITYLEGRFWGPLSSLGFVQRLVDVGESDIRNLSDYFHGEGVGHLYDVGKDFYSPILVNPLLNLVDTLTQQVLRQKLETAKIDLPSIESRKMDSLLSWMGTEIDIGSDGSSVEEESDTPPTEENLDTLNYKLSTADSLRLAGRCDTATLLYTQVLETDAINERALSGISLCEEPKPKVRIAKGYIGWEIEPRIPVAGVELNIDFGISSVRVGNTNEKGVFYLDISEPVRLGVSSIPAGKRTINIKHSYLERKEFLIDPEAAGARFSGDTLLLDTLTVRFQAGVGEFVEIEGGTFRMGSEDSLDNEFRSAMPIHEVSLSTYRLQKYEVTVGQYMYYVQEGGGRVPEWIEKGNEYNIFGQNEDQHYTRIGNSLYTLDHPVTGISWEDAMAYASWWSDRTGRRYGLPTEAQWEFAARGGNLSQGYVYAGSNELTEVGWYANNSGSRTHQVGQKKANELGLYDMSGNVWEWCADWYDTYPSSLQTDPTGPDNGDYRVVRGGSWYFDPNLARVSNRRYIIPLIRSSIVGFRLCRY